MHSLRTIAVTKYYWSCQELNSSRNPLILLAASVEYICNVFESYKTDLHGIVMLQQRESAWSTAGRTIGPAKGSILLGALWFFLQDLWDIYTVYLQVTELIYMVQLCYNTKKVVVAAETAMARHLGHVQRVCI